MVGHMQVPPLQRKETALMEGKRKLGGAVINKESVAFHWLIWCQERRVFLLPFGLCYHCRA